MSACFPDFLRRKIRRSVVRNSGVMRDFHQTSSVRSTDEQERALKRKLLALQVVGGLIAVFGAVAAAAYFSELALLPFLEDRQVALKWLVIAGAALLAEGVASGWLHFRLGKLKRSRES